MSKPPTNAPRSRRGKAADSACVANAPLPHLGGYQVRAARVNDAAVIARFNREMALETESRKLSPQRVLRGVKALLTDAAKGSYYVAESGGEVIGQLLITYEWSDWRNGNFWWIQSVFVTPSWRGRGVFKALHAHIEGLARKDRWKSYSRRNTP